jgi:hypothetical protein
VLQKPADSLSVNQLITVKDTIKPIQVLPSPDSVRNFLFHNLVRLNLFGKSEFLIEKEKQTIQNEWLFYYIIGLFLLFGLLKLAYSRYFNNLFRVFFKTSLKINQIREQLVQSGLQSLLFNILFAISSGTYIYLLIRHFQISFQVAPVLIPIISAAIIGTLYVGKYLFLKVSGWLFNISSASDTYAFIAFLINKLVGIILLPFILIIAFAKQPVSTIAITLSLAIICGLFLYRFLRAYNTVQTNLNVSRFHFFIYFLAFEIAPLLVIYKILIGYI